MNRVSLFSEILSYYYYDFSYENYRNRRLNDRLKSINLITLTDIKKIQNDIYKNIYKSVNFFKLTQKNLAGSDEWPTWSETSEFRAARELQRSGMQ